MGSDNININDILQKNAVENKISCAKAFAISKETGLFPDLIGIAMDNAKIKISDCQMGLFGCNSGNKVIRPADNVSEELEDLIFSYLGDDGKLECRAAWSIASELKIKKIEVASACEKMKIKISRCQLGGF